MLLFPPLKTEEHVVKMTKLNIRININCIFRRHNSEVLGEMPFPQSSGLGGHGKSNCGLQYSRTPGLQDLQPTA